MKLKRYKVTAKNNVEYLMTNYIKAESIDEAKEIFTQKFENGDVACGYSELQFQEVKREEAKCI